MILSDKLMKYVVFKKRTEKEIRDKCKMMKYEDDYIDEAITYLKENEYINDERYIEKYIQNIIKLKRCSINEIKIDLLKRGIADDLIDKYIDEELEAFEEESAKILAEKKIKTMEVEKIKRYLLNKGFSYSNVSKAIDNLPDIEDN